MGYLSLVYKYIDLLFLILYIKAVDVADDYSGFIVVVVGSLGTIDSSAWARLSRLVSSFPLGRSHSIWAFGSVLSWDTSPLTETKNWGIKVENNRRFWDSVIRELCR